jgi:uncharacterized protein
MVGDDPFAVSRSQQMQKTAPLERAEVTGGWLTAVAKCCWPPGIGAPLQIIDLPGIIEGAKDGRGRGRQVIAVAKTCHLIFIVLDVNKPLTDKRVIEAELEGFGIRINKEPPNISFKKKDKGGLNITSTVPLSHIDHDEIKAVMSEYRINSADITIRCDATVDDLIDVLEARSRR